jgi:hypothetical protein
MEQQINSGATVDLFTGQAALPVNIAALPGHNGMDLRLDIYYSSNVRRDAGVWNLERPTGVLGLGWSLPGQMIFTDPQLNGAISSNSYFWLQDGRINALVCAGMVGNVYVYRAENYFFGKILYYPEAEKWEITREDGAIQVYGDLHSGGNTLWWNLSRITNRFHDTITFYYSNTQAPVGNQSGQEYTQASYLEKIEGAHGETLQFEYKDKGPTEFQSPHTAPLSPNVYQDCFETKYLDKVIEKSLSGEVLITHQLIYETFLGRGSFTKRLLTSIRDIHPNQQALPEIRFSYYGDAASDEVSIANIYQVGTGALYGALKQITLPEGGTISYQYDEMPIGYSVRDLAAFLF